MTLAEHARKIRDATQKPNVYIHHHTRPNKPKLAPNRVANRRPARTRRAPQLFRPANARCDEIERHAGHPKRRLGCELGINARAVQVGLRRDEPNRRVPRGPLLSPLDDLCKPPRLVGDHVADGARHDLRAADVVALRDGNFRSVLYPGRARADR